MNRWHGSGISGTRTWTLIVEARPVLGWSWRTYPPGKLVPTYRYARPGMGHTWTRRGAYRAARRDIRREMRRERRLTARDAARIHEEVAT